MNHIEKAVYRLIRPYLAKYRKRLAKSGGDKAGVAERIAEDPGYEKRKEDASGIKNTEL